MTRFDVHGVQVGRNEVKIHGVLRREGVEGSQWATDIEKLERREQHDAYVYG